MPGFGKGPLLDGGGDSIPEEKERWLNPRRGSAVKKIKGEGGLGGPGWRSDLERKKPIRLKGKR